jgi:hypothetical protein
MRHGRSFCLFCIDLIDFHHKIFFFSPRPEIPAQGLRCVAFPENPPPMGSRSICPNMQIIQALRVTSFRYPSPDFPGNPAPISPPLRRIHAPRRRDFRNTKRLTRIAAPVSIDQQSLVDARRAGLQTVAYKRRESRAIGIAIMHIAIADVDMSDHPEVAPGYPNAAPISRRRAGIGDFQIPDFPIGLVQ